VPAAAAHWFERHTEARQGRSVRQPGRFQLLTPAVVGHVTAWGVVLQARVVQVRHRAGVAAACRQPSCPPRQRPPPINLIARTCSDRPALRRPLSSPQPGQLRRQRPGAVLQIPQVIAAVERPPVDAAGPATPIAGLRGARTGVVGPRPAATSVGLAEPRAGRNGDLPGPAGLPATHEVSPPLAWLPGSDQPTRRAGTAKSEPHRGSTVLPAGRARRARSGERPATRMPTLGPTRSTRQVVDGSLGAVLAAGHGREVTRRTYRRQLSPAALTVVDLVGLKVPLDRVRVRGLLLQVGGSLRFPNRPTELQAMFGRFHRPEPWSPCLGPLAPCRLRPARPGLSGAARHQRSRYPGQPRQARSTSRAGPRHRRRSQSPLGWSRDGSVRSWVSVLAYCELQAIAGGVRLGWHRQHPCLASKLHGRFASRSAGR
jgi:hypothetical protein